MKFLIFVASQVKKNYEEIDKLTLNKSTGPIRIQAWYRITPPFCTKLKYNTKPVSIIPQKKHISACLQKM